MTKEEIKSSVLATMLEEVVKDENGTVWITKNRGMNMRLILDKIRENYYGIFEKPKDHLGQEKIFNPLTETMVWENVKNLDVDTKDINIKAKRSGKEDAAVEMRYKLKDWMSSVDFGEQLNKWEHQWTLDGHLIVKTIDYYDIEEKRWVIKCIPVDLRNTFYDKHCDSIKETPFIERSLQTLSFIKQAYGKDWTDVDKIVGRNNVARVNQESKDNISSINNEVELYERWGEIPKSWITGKSEDANDFVYGHCVASNIRDNGAVHLVESVKKKKNPYEDVSFEDTPNRHPGRGVGEKVLYLQLYLNTIFNVRRINNLTLANQLFQFKDGTGITPDKIKNLVAGGAIGVQNVGDIARIDTRNINFNESLSEEQNLIQTANRATSTQEAGSGEALPSSTPATNAIIQNQAVKTSYALRQERFGLFLSRLMKNQVAPRLNKYYEDVDEIPMENDEFLKQSKVNIANSLTLKHINESGNSDGDIEALANGYEKAVKNKNNFFLQNDNQSYDDLMVEFFVTNESFDKQTLVQNLKDVLFNFSQISQNPEAKPTLRELYDVLGLDSKELIPETTEQPMQAPQAPQQAPGATTQGDVVSQATNRVNQGSFA